jgi:hypothetical protein
MFSIHNKNQRKKWHPRVHTKMNYKHPTLNNFEHFKLQSIPGKGLGVVCVKTTPSQFLLVGQYPNFHKNNPPHTNMGLDIDTKNKVGLGNWTSVDPKLKNGCFPRSSNLDKYLACRINEPSMYQSCEGPRFHPNCGWRVGECSETKEVWQEFWTYRKIFQGEELTIDYGTAYPRTYKTYQAANRIRYEELNSKRIENLKKLGPNQVTLNNTINTIYLNDVVQMKQVCVWAPSNVGTSELIAKINEWMRCHPNKPPRKRFIQDYISSAWPMMGHLKSPFFFSIDNKSRKVIRKIPMFFSGGADKENGTTVSQDIKRRVRLTRPSAKSFGTYRTNQKHLKKLEKGWKP